MAREIFEFFLRLTLHNESMYLDENFSKSQIHPFSRFIVLLGACKGPWELNIEFQEGWHENAWNVTSSSDIIGFSVSRQDNR